MAIIGNVPSIGAVPANSSDNITITGTWTKSDETTSPLAGSKSPKLTQASGSSGAQATAGNISLEIFEKDNTLGYEGVYTYSGNNNEIDFVAYDVTNSQELGRISLLASSSSKLFRLVFNTQSSTDTIKYYFEVMTENIGAVLIFDSISKTLNPLPTVESVETEYYKADDGAGMGSTATKIPYFTNIRDNATGSLISVTNDSTNGLVITALKDTVVTASFYAKFTSSNAQTGFSINTSSVTSNVGDLTESELAAWTNVPASNIQAGVATSVEMKAGDILRPHTDGGTFSAGDDALLSITAQATSANVVFEGADTNVQNYYIVQAGSALTSATGELEYNLSTASINKSGEDLITVANASGRTEFTATKNITVDASSSNMVTVLGRQVKFVIVKSTGTEYIHGSANEFSGTGSSSVSGSFILNKDDYFYIQTSVDNGTASSGDFGTTSAQHKLLIVAKEIAQEVVSVPVTNEVENVYSARIDNNGSTASIKSQSSTWLDSVSRSSTGVIVIDYTSLGLTEVPSIQVKAANEASAAYLSVIDAASSTGATFSTLSYDSPFGVVDSDLIVTIQRQGSDYKAPKGYFLGNLSQPVGYVDVHATNYVYTVTASTAYKTIPLVSIDSQFGSISSNQLTLESGEYEYEIGVGNIASSNSDFRLYNVTDASTYEEMLDFGFSAVSAYTTVPIMGRIKITDNKAFEFQMKSDGGNAEVATRIKIRKLR